MQFFTTVVCSLHATTAAAGAEYGLNWKDFHGQIFDSKDCPASNLDHCHLADSSVHYPLHNVRCAEASGMLPYLSVLSLCIVAVSIYLLDGVSGPVLCASPCHDSSFYPCFRSMGRTGYKRTSHRTANFRWQTSWWPTLVRILIPQATTKRCSIGTHDYKNLCDTHCKHRYYSFPMAGH
jgi:hypothetical protein